MHSTHSPLRLIGSSPIDCNFLPFQLLLDKNPKSTKLIKDLRLEGTISNLCLLFEPLTSMSRILHGEFKERKKMELRFSLNLVFGFYLFLVCTLLLLPSHWQACKEWLHMSVPLFHQVKIWTGFLFLFFSIANDLTPFNTDFKKNCTWPNALEVSAIHCVRENAPHHHYELVLCIWFFVLIYIYHSSTPSTFPLNEVIGKW